jgi:Fe-S oxidoreductase
MIRGEQIAEGVRSREVRAALDLCLACKSCKSECPASVDMARYKSEILYQRYRHRPRPRSHYSVGRLPQWAKLAALAPRLVNRVMRARGTGRLVCWLAGIDSRRELPQFADTTFKAMYAAAKERS